MNRALYRINSERPAMAPVVVTVTPEFYQPARGWLREGIPYFVRVNDFHLFSIPRGEIEKIPQRLVYVETLLPSADSFVVAISPFLCVCVHNSSLNSVNAV